MGDEDLAADHTPEAIRARLSDGPGGSVLRDVVFGAVDGTVTTFAIVAGVAGAGLDAAVALVLGVANLLADGFSMAVSNFLGTRSEQQRRERIRREEEHHVAVVPDGEREEVRQLLTARGLAGEQLNQVVEAITADRRRWVEVMLTYEHGFSPERPDPIRAAAATFGAFVAVGFLPLGAFALDALPVVAVDDPFRWSIVLTAVAFLVVGATRGAVAGGRRLSAGLATLAVGGGAAAVAYGVGTALRHVA